MHYAMPCLTGRVTYSDTKKCCAPLEVPGERRRVRGTALAGRECAKLPPPYQLDVIAQGSSK